MPGEKRVKFADAMYEMEPRKKHHRTLPEEPSVRGEKEAVACNDEPIDATSRENGELEHIEMEEGEIDVSLEERVVLSQYGIKYAECEDEEGQYFSPKLEEAEYFRDE
jgi:hypothetical protein